VAIVPREERQKLTPRRGQGREFAGEGEEVGRRPKRDLSLFPWDNKKLLRTGIDLI
jgi:hypothetical protein